MSEGSLSKELMDALLSERKRDRRWRNVRFFCWFLFAALFMLLIFLPNGKKASSFAETNTPYVSLVRLNGIIMPGSNFSANKVIPVLNRAFRDKQAKGVILVINSPGGSPVQATIIHDKIMQLKKKYRKKVIVLGQDTLASGAYLVATAADEIYVHPDTVTGSIGVIMNGFGFTGLMEKIGVTRRVFTAGENKDRLDPFMPLSPQDQTKIHSILTQVHQNFINDVLLTRKSKLKGNPSKLFSGDFWTGTKAVQLGLADGTGNLWTIMEKQFDVTHYRRYRVKASFFESLMKGVETSLSIGSIGLSHQGAPIQALLKY